MKFVQRESYSKEIQKWKYIIKKLRFIEMEITLIDEKLGF